MLRVGLANYALMHLKLPDQVKILASYTDLIQLKAFELDESDLKELEELKETLELEYIVHVPFPGETDKLSFDLPSHRKILEQSIENARKIEAKFIVVHPNPRDEGIINYLSSLDAENIILENSFKKNSSLVFDDDFLKLQELFPICLDIAHYYLVTRSSTAVAELLAKLRNVKLVHANDVVGFRDVHAYPGDGEIAWKKILKFVKVPIILEVTYLSPEKFLRFKEMLVKARLSKT